MEFTKKILLPGAGLYDKASLLSKELEIRNLTVAEEKLFLSSSGDVAFEKMLKACVKEDIDPKELFVADRVYILIQIRMLTYGDRVYATLKCPDCGYNGEVVVDMNEMDLVSLTKEEYDKVRVFTLPKSKAKVVVKLPRGEDTDEVSQYTSYLKKNKVKVDVGMQYVCGLAVSLESVDGEELSLVEKIKFFEGMHSYDAAYLRKKIEGLSLGYTMEASVICPDCGNPQTVSVELSEEFFRPVFDDISE